MSLSSVDLRRVDLLAAKRCTQARSSHAGVTQRCVHGPPGGHPSGSGLPWLSANSGSTKDAIDSTTSASDPPEIAARFKNAAHWVCLLESSLNVEVRAMGARSGTGVRRRSKVAVMASRSVVEILHAAVGESKVDHRLHLLGDDGL